MDFDIRVSNQLAQHLKALRKSAGLTQSQLGERLGVGQTRVADIEKNPGSISVDQLMAILSALDMHLVLRPVSSPKARQKSDW